MIALLDPESAPHGVRSLEVDSSLDCPMGARRVSTVFRLPFARCEVEAEVAEEGFRGNSFCLNCVPRRLTSAFQRSLRVMLASNALEWSMEI